jgi:hypothetical protein
MQEPMQIVAEKVANQMAIAMILVVVIVVATAEMVAVIKR